MNEVVIWVAYNIEVEQTLIVIRFTGEVLGVLRVSFNVLFLVVVEIIVKPWPMELLFRLLPLDKIVSLNLGHLDLLQLGIEVSIHDGPQLVFDLGLFLLLGFFAEFVLLVFLDLVFEVSEEGIDLLFPLLVLHLNLSGGLFCLHVFDERAEGGGSEVEISLLLSLSQQC